MENQSGPALSSEIAKQLANTVAEKERAAEAAKPKVEEKKPEAHIAAMADALLKEAAPPQTAVWDRKSTVVKQAKNAAVKEKLPTSLAIGGLAVVIVVLVLAIVFLLSK